ncbi:response regulator transcription factor [Planctomycetaceae bacterium]|nr:response regulator transcription factor [bacterium]MDB4786547.1 response regulator transcription factor [Planctomycetaceae bacterium]MDC0262259.1 response regulator transcription factor [Planctomycetaceae bacterium]MDC0273673.1 response regulator transcription factor [Planctomycetaceae bacterium]MDG2388188.1 response regulator transcription factor [Planctomycetaceae bacterium]
MTESAYRVLVVEDETALAEGLKFNFEQEGYHVLLAGDGPTAIDLAQSNPPPDVVVLDIMLPSMSGYEVCEKIRQTNQQIPILILSARTLSEDKAQAFDAGSDQYMTKPFALPELLSRVRNLIERRQSVPPPRKKEHIDTYEFDDTRIDFRKFELESRGEKHSLTTMEMQLLRYFVQNPDVVLSRNEILKDVWDEPGEVTTRSIDNFVLRLRRMIEPKPNQPKYLLSVRGTGYRFTPHGDVSG